MFTMQLNVYLIYVKSRFAMVVNKNRQYSNVELSLRLFHVTGASDITGTQLFL